MKKEPLKVEAEAHLRNDEKPNTRASPILASNTQLLKDIAAVFRSTKKSHLSTAQIKKKLLADSSKPWFKYRAGKCISKKMIDTILKHNNIFKNKITIKDIQYHVYSADLFKNYK